MSSSIFIDLNNTELSGVAFKDQMLKKMAITFLTSKGESTIPELADLLTISVPKTSELVIGLQKDGLVKDTSRKTDGPGRKAVIYSLNPESCYFLGVEIRKYKINIGLMSFNAEIIESSVNIPFPFLGATESLDAVIREIR